MVDMAEAGRLERPRVQPLTCVRDRLLIQPGRFQISTVGPRRHDSNVRPPPSEGGALTTELRRAGVDGRIRTCMDRFRTPVPHPFGHVDVAPPTGLAPATSGVTDRRSPTELRRLGTRPGPRTQLFRGKSPVPYQSGVTRMERALATARVSRAVASDPWSWDR